MLDSTIVPKPPPLPKELRDWEELDIEYYRKPWEHYEPFLTLHGYTLFGSPAYDDPLLFRRSPTKPPRNPIYPADDEDFVFRPKDTLVEHFRQESYFQLSPMIHLALDNLGRQVFIKAASIHSSEYRVLKLLSSEPLRSDSRNYTIPLLAFIDAGDFIFMVQSYWGTGWTWPDIDTVQSRLKIARQLLQGLAFMHENNIGHGDIHPQNILWNHDDSRDLETVDGCLFHSTFDFRMAFIDFGASALFQPGESHLVPVYSRPPSSYAAPEQSREGEFYDLFASDVYNLGKVLREELNLACENGSHAALEISRVAPEYSQLLENMTRTEPSERITSVEALESLLRIISSMEERI